MLPNIEILSCSDFYILLKKNQHSIMLKSVILLILSYIQNVSFLNSENKISVSICTIEGFFYCTL